MSFWQKWIFFKNHSTGEFIWVSETVTHSCSVFLSECCIHFKQQIYSYIKKYGCLVPHTFTCQIVQNSLGPDLGFFTIDLNIWLTIIPHNSSRTPSFCCNCPKFIANFPLAFGGKLKSLVFSSQYEYKTGRCRCQQRRCPAARNGVLHPDWGHEDQQRLLKKKKNKNTLPLTASRAFLKLSKTRNVRVCHPQSIYLLRHTDIGWSTDTRADCDKSSQVSCTIHNRHRSFHRLCLQCAAVKCTGWRKEMSENRLCFGGQDLDSSACTLFMFAVASLNLLGQTRTPRVVLKTRGVHDERWRICKHQARECGRWQVCAARPHTRGVKRLKAGGTSKFRVRNRSNTGVKSVCSLM